MSSHALPAKAEQLFRYLFEQASLGIAVEDLDGKILLANPALCSMLGYHDDELAGMHCSEFANPEDSQDDGALFQQLRAGVIDHYTLEKRYVTKQGVPLWGRLNVSLLKNEDEDPPLVFAFVEDITEHRQAEEALLESEQRLRLAIRAGRMYAFDWDVVTDRIVRSRECIDILNWQDPEHDTGREFHARIHPDDLASYTAMETRLTPDHPTYRIAFRILSPDGSVTWLEDTGRASFDAQAKMVRVTGMVGDITERKLAEEKLRHSEQRFRLAAQAGKMYAYEWDPTTDGVTRSEAYGNMIGLMDPAEQLTRRQLAARVHPEDRTRFVTSVDRLIPENPTIEISYRVTRPDGSVIWLEKSARAFFDAHGKLMRVMGMVVDITERKRVEEALKKSEEKFSKAFQQSPMALTLTSAKDQRFIDVNETFERITGWRRDQVIGRTSLDIGLWVNPAERAELAKRLLTERSLRNLEFRFRMRDGSIRNGLSSAELIELDGQPCVLGVTADITDYKRSQEALRESEARERSKVKELEAILDAVPVPVLIAHDTACRHITGNRAASEQLREAKGQNLSQSAPPGERPAFRQIKNGVEIPADLLPMQQAAATGKPIYGCALSLLFEDGTIREEIANAIPLLDESGKPRGAVGASMDVTELKRTEGALRESEDKLRLLLDSTAEAIYGIDLEHRCTFCNPAGLRALGYEHLDEVLGKNMHTLIHHTRADGTPFPVEACRVHRVTQTGEGAHAEDELLWRANGTSFPAEYWSYPQRRGQEVVGGVVAFIDITERKLAEAALANVSRKLIEAQEQERSRIGRELHDDIGQRLALLAVELQQLHKDPLVFPRVRGRLGELQKKVAEIAADSQSLSHELHSASLQYLGITVAMRGFCREFSEQQKVKVDFKSNDLPTALSADVSLCLFRILQEALHNSAKHSGGKSFEVRLWGTADEIHFTVKDSGKGFDRGAANTNQGLGLISMEERLKLVNGTLSIESQPGRGTTIEARVPVSWGSDSMRAVG
jgi:PAS domain S-box-containing protein